MTTHCSTPHAASQPYTYRMLDSWRDLTLAAFVALTDRSDDPAVLYHGLRRFIAPMPQDCQRQADGTWQAAFGHQVLATNIATHDAAFRTLSTWFNATYPATLGQAKRMLAGEGEDEEVPIIRAASLAIAIACVQRSAGPQHRTRVQWASPTMLAGEHAPIRDLVAIFQPDAAIHLHAARADGGVGIPICRIEVRP